MAQPATYRVLQSIHLGGTDPHITLAPKEIIHFDGVRLQRENGDNINLSQPGAFRGAIKVGWVVPIESTQQEAFRPKPAGVEVHSATSTNSKREPISMGRVSDEERDLGTLSDLRPSNAPATHKAKSAGEVSQTQMRVERRDSDDGVVVGRMKLSASSGPVQIGKDDAKIRHQLENGERSGFVPARPTTRVATGDVDVAISGEHLETLLPNAASSGTPKPGLHRDQPTRPRGELPDNAEQALRDWVATGESWDEYQVTLGDVRILARAVLRKLDAVRPAAEAAARAMVPSAPPEEAAPQDETFWDLSPHWKTRQKNLVKFQDDPESLYLIRELDSSTGVQKRVDEYLAALG